MKVRITNYSSAENPIITIYKAYRLCYSKGNQSEIKLPMKDGSIDYDAMSDFIVDKMMLGHTTPLEHVSFTFEISGVSRALTHQLVRHRTGKFNQQSQRYVKLGQFEYVIPPEIAKDPMAKLIYEDQMSRTQEIYTQLTEMLLAKYLLEGMSKREAEKKAIEDARYVFPNACTSNITVTMDLNNFRKFYNLRNCKHAQWEIRKLAKLMGVLVKDIVPFALKGAMNCGKSCFECINLEVGELNEINEK